MLDFLRVVIWPLTILAIAVLGWWFNRDNATKRLRLAIQIDEVRHHAESARKLAQSAFDAAGGIAKGHSEVIDQVHALATKLGDAVAKLSQRIEAVEAVARAAGEAKPAPVRRV